MSRVLSSTHSSLTQTAAAAAVTAPALQLDAALATFSDQATHAQSIGNMTFAGLIGRMSRLGFLSSGAARLLGPHFQNFASQVFSLGMEAAAFEGLNRAFSSFETHESFRQSWTAHFTNFSTFRLVGALGGSSSALTQHFTQSFAMVAGHQVAGVLGVEEKPRGSLSEQILQASIATAQIQVGSVLGHFISGNHFHSLERKWEQQISIVASRSPSHSRILPTWRAEASEFRAEIAKWEARIRETPTGTPPEMTLSNGVKLRYDDVPRGKVTFVELGNVPIEALNPFLFALQEHYEGIVLFVVPPDLPERLLIWGNEQLQKRQRFADRVLKLYSEFEADRSLENSRKRQGTLGEEVESVEDLFRQQRDRWNWVAVHCERHTRLDRCSLGLVIDHHFSNKSLGISSMLSLTMTDLLMGRPLDAEFAEMLARLCLPQAREIVHEASYLAEDFLRERSSFDSNRVWVTYSPNAKNVCFRSDDAANAFRRAIFHFIGHAAPHASTEHGGNLSFHLERLEDGALRVQLKLHYNEMDCELTPFIPHEFEKLSEVLAQEKWGSIEVEQSGETEVKVGFRVPRQAFEAEAIAEITSEDGAVSEENLSRRF